MKGLRLILITLTGLLFFTLSASALDVKEYQLKNGLKLLVVENHKAPIVTFQIWYRIGSRDEPKAKTGISHLLEHMMFKGTKNYGPKTFSRLIQKNGGIDNAFTTKDYTMYYENLSSDRLELALELEADRMENLLIRPEDVRYERSVVMEERRMRYEDDPQNLLYEEVIATAFLVHPYRNPVIGWMDDIAALGPEDLRHHYGCFYRPDNAVVVVAGDVRAEDVYSLVKKHFGTIAPSTPSLCKGRVTKEPPQQGKRIVYLKKEARLPYVMLAYHVPSFPHRDAASLDVLSTIISGKSGLLYKRLVRKDRIALNVFASYSGLYKDPFLFLFGGTPRPGIKAEELVEAILKEIESIKKNPPTEHELQKARNQVEASFIMGQDSIFFQAELLGMFEMIGGWQLIDDYLKAIQTVTKEDVVQAARSYFREENLTVGILIPQKKEKE